MKEADMGEVMVAEIQRVVGRALAGLFTDRHAESFYFCVLVTTEEGHPPVIAFWSEQTLVRELSRRRLGAEHAEWLRWSYADSPDLEFGAAELADLQPLFAERPSIDELSAVEWLIELDMRVAAMEEALRRLDATGMFAFTQPRDQILINVEMMPPTHDNTLRAMRLNRLDNFALSRWLAEAAESAPE